MVPRPRTQICAMQRIYLTMAACVSVWAHTGAGAAFVAALWVGGGREDRAAGLADRDHRPLYGVGGLLRLNPATGEVIARLEWRNSAWP